MRLVVVLAAAAEPGWENLAQYGVLGLVVLGFVLGKIVPGYIYERKVLEADAERAENRRLEETMKEKVIPALVRSADVMADVLAILGDLAPPPRKGRS